MLQSLCGIILYILALIITHIRYDGNLQEFFTLTKVLFVFLSSHISKMFIAVKSRVENITSNSNMASCTLVGLSATSGVPLFVRHTGPGKPVSREILL